MQRRTLAAFAIFAASAVWTTSETDAQTKPIEGNAETGRTLALQACSGCHLVLPDQPFKPIYSGPPRPPDFGEIANRSSTTAASLRHHLEMLPAVPQNLHMVRPILSNQQLRDVVAFMISLREPTR